MESKGILFTFPCIQNLKMFCLVILPATRNTQWIHLPVEEYSAFICHTQCYVFYEVIKLYIISKVAFVTITLNILKLINIKKGNKNILLYKIAAINFIPKRIVSNHYLDF